jgi:hypothetical protein
MQLNGGKVNLSEQYLWSNDFWNTAIAAAFGFIFAALAAWATLYSANPKRRLVWAQTQNVPLLHSIAPMPHVEVNIGGAQVRNPRVVQVTVRNTGRRDIQSNMFHNGSSVVFDFHAYILSVTPTVNSPAELEISGTQLRLKPSLIPRGQSISWAVLVDGPEADVTCTAPLVDVPCRKVKDESELKTLSERSRANAPLLALFCVPLALLWFNQNTSILDWLPGSTASQTKPLKDKITKLENCRYWDQHDPKRSASECPVTKKPDEASAAK